MKLKQVAAVTLKIEEFVSSALLCTISVLVFVSAVARTIGRPINWAEDVSLLAFAWLTFIGADVLTRSGKLINIDMLIYKLPRGFQKAVGIISDVMILVFLAVLAFYGCKLVSQSWYRSFNTLKLSYAWCTMAVPVGAFLMLVSRIGHTVSDMARPVKEWGKKDA